MLIYIIIITLVIVLCLYKMSTKNVNNIEDDDDDGLAFFYMKSNSGSSGSGGNSGGDKNKNVQKLKNIAQKAFDKSDKFDKKYWKEMEKAQGSNGYINRIEAARLAKIMEQKLTADQKANAAQKTYETALGKVPTVGQVNSEGTSVWTDRGWLTTSYGAGVQPGAMNINAAGEGSAARIYDGTNWVSIISPP